MAEEPWETQRKQKYRDHDFVLEDMKPIDIEIMRGSAVQGFVRTPESDNLKLLVIAFMGYLTSKGYRIVKKEPGSV